LVNKLPPVFEQVVPGVKDIADVGSSLGELTKQILNPLLFAAPPVDVEPVTYTRT
jgi:hypothetical protein